MGFLDRLEHGSQIVKTPTELQAEERRMRLIMSSRQFRRETSPIMRAESGVGLLVEQLGQILEGQNDGGARGANYDIRLRRLKDSEYPRIEREDHLATVDLAFWDLRSGARGRVSGSDYISTSWTLKYLVVETGPWDITFYGGSKAIVTHDEWRADKNILEEALGNAYNNPKYHSFEANREYSPLPPRRSSPRAYSPAYRRPGM